MKEPSRLGVHQFRNYESSSSFFVERPFGNDIYCADFLQPFDFDFLKSRGGVRRFFIQNQKSLNSVHIELFERFGARAITLTDEGKHDANPLPMDQFGRDHFDHHLVFEQWQECWFLSVRQRGRRLCFVGDSLIFDGDHKIFKGEAEISNKLKQQKFYQKADYLFFARHRGQGVMVKDKPSFFERLLKLTKK